MDKLPLRIALHDDEDVFSIAARLALRSRPNGLSFIRGLLETPSLKSLGNSAPSIVLRRLSDISGYPIEILIQNSLHHDGSAVWIRGHKLSTTSVGPLLVRPARICSDCLSEDLDCNEDELSCRPYRRLAWRLRSLHSCQKHQVALQTHCPDCRTRLSSVNINVRFCSCGFDLAHAAPKFLEENLIIAENYIYNRIFNPANVKDHWLLKQLAPAEAELALTQIGIMVLGPKRRKAVMGLAPEERMEVASLGFGAISSKESFLNLLDRISAKSLPSKTGPHSIYGHLYRWLYTDDNPAYQPIRDIIFDHFQRTQKATISTRLFYRNLENARLISVGTAASQCGCSVERFNSLAVAFGHQAKNRTHRSEHISKKIAAQVKNLINGSIDANEAAERLGISVDLKKEFLKSDRFAIQNLSTGAHRLLIKREVEFIERLYNADMPQYTDLPKGCLTICTAAQRTFLKVPKIVERLIDGELLPIGTLIGLSGLPSVIVNTDDVRKTIRATDTPLIVSIDALQALGLTDFRQLRAARDAGLIFVQTERSRTGQRLIAISKEEVEHFCNNYVLLANIKKQDPDLHARTLGAIRSGDVEVSVNHSRFRIIRRSSLQRLSK